MFVWKNDRKEVHLLTVKDQNHCPRVWEFVYCRKKNFGVFRTRLYWLREGGGSGAGEGVFVLLRVVFIILEVNCKTCFIVESF